MEDVQERCECGHIVATRPTTSSRPAPERCPLCRSAQRITVTDRDRAWWLERYTLHEIRQLANAIWPELAA